MRFKMIGYGKSHYRANSGQQVEWPVVGVALQKSYISVYLSVTKDGAPLVQSYTGRDWANVEWAKTILAS